MPAMAAIAGGDDGDDGGDDAPDAPAADDAPADARRPARPGSAGVVKIAVVVQRYGADINGGAELHARYIAEHLARHVEVEVLTTCARDYITWAERLPARAEPGGRRRRPPLPGVADRDRRRTSAPGRIGSSTPRTR